MHKKFFITTAILMAVAAGLATSALAQHSGRGFGHHSGWMLKHMAKELNLTDAQQTQIKGIMADGKTEDDAPDEAAPPEQAGGERKPQRNIQ